MRPPAAGGQKKDRSKMPEIASWTLLAVAATGLLAGAVHALSGPDHLAAVAPLVAANRHRRWAIGAVWGFGHSMGVWLLGFGLLFLRNFLPIEAISSWSEWLVGIVLIAMGLWGLRKLLATWVHTHEHAHDGEQHRHVHLHWPGIAHRPEATGDHPRTGFHSHAALGIGALHGLAGGSYLLGVLPTLILPSLSEAAGYLILFGFGSVMGMTAFSWAIGQLADRLPNRLTGGKINGASWLLAGSSLTAIAVGCFWLLA